MPQNSRDVPHAAPVRLLAVGDLTPENGFGRLIRVFAGLARTDRRARLIVLGEGPDRQALERLIAEERLATQVGLPGAVGRARMGELLQRADVLVVPTVLASGSFPAALPVAMAGGLCIVAARGSSLDYLLEDGGNALLVDGDDDAELSRALYLAVSNEALRRSLGDAAAATIRGGLGGRRSA